MTEESLKNIALLIDADNTTPRGIDPVLTALAKLGQVNIRRAYGNWAKPALTKWAGLTNRYGIRPQQQFDLTKGKNATDMAMTIDAIDLLYQGKVDGFGIMSSDSDFTPLVTRLRQDGLTVYGFGSAKAPDAFQNACTRFIDIDALIAGDEEIDDSGSETPSSSKPDTKPRIDDEMIDLLGKSWRNAKRDAEGYARLSEVGQIAGNRSSFDVRNYGYRRLSDLLRSLEHFEVKEKDGHLVVKRLR
ncbi:MAG: hypothetical protein CL820_01195 [Croceicoccus sp.]|nr:hypothetical protein [Croceicoccus sp.]MAL24505.1 hypothetical protein [Croceicoccus sp.]|tara:strand:- start:20187 stop:20921 length:735 start_codon:yes stop_codon:yes gene_type:complete